MNAIRGKCGGREKTPKKENLKSRRCTDLPPSQKVEQDNIYRFAKSSLDQGSCQVFRGCNHKIEHIRNRDQNEPIKDDIQYLRLTCFALLFKDRRSEESS